MYVGVIFLVITSSHKFLISSIISLESLTYINPLVVTSGPTNNTFSFLDMVALISTIPFSESISRSLITKSPISSLLLPSIKISST